jgi:hypothetical protein
MARTAGIGELAPRILEQDSWDTITKAGQPRQESPDKTAGEGSRVSTARIGNRTARRWDDSNDRTARTRQPGWGNCGRAVRIGHRGQDH